MYLGLYILQALIVWVGPLIVWFVALILLTGVAAGVSRGASPQTAGTLVGLMTLFGFAAVGGFALWMLLCLGLAFPACVVERNDAGGALHRRLAAGAPLFDLSDCGRIDSRTEQPAKFPDRGDGGDLSDLWIFVCHAGLYQAGLRDRVDALLLRPADSQRRL